MAAGVSSASDGAPLADVEVSVCPLPAGGTSAGAHSRAHRTCTTPELAAGSYRTEIVGARVARVRIGGPCGWYAATAPSHHSLARADTSLIVVRDGDVTGADAAIPVATS